MVAEKSRTNESERAAMTPLRIFDLIFSGLMLLATAGVTVWHGLNGFESAGPALLLSNLALWLIPFACTVWFRRAVSDGVLLILEIFLFFASFLGSCVRLYDSVNWYDAAVHTVVGYVAALLGLFIVCKLADVNKMRPALVVIVCVAVSLAVAAVWEIYEFVTDLLLAGTAQGTPVETVTGSFVVDVRDTMEDILCNTGGAIVFAIHYLAHLWSKKDLGMRFFKRDFTGTKKAEQPVPHANTAQKRTEQPVPPAKEETTAAELPAPHAKEETECLSCNTHAQNAEKNSKNL